MATKAQIDAIFANVATGQPNTAVEALANWNALKNELYSDAVSDNQTSETYTTKSGTTINYSLTLKKVGNQPMLKGTITNTGLSMITTQNVFAWKNNEFKPKAGFTYLFDAKQGNSVVKCLLNSTGLSISSPMASGIYFIDNFQIYIAQD